MNGRPDDITEDLIVSYLNGNLSDEFQIAQLEKWLKEEENLKDAREAYESWELSNMVVPRNTGAPEAFDQVSARLNLKTIRKQRTVSLWWYAAASVILAIGLVFVLSVQKEVEMVHLASSESVMERQLPDGSTVSLNAKTSIRFNEVDVLSGKQRIIELQGEAFFKVVHDPDRPFIIRTNDAEVQVLGTQFMVKTSTEDPTKVLVTEGRVQVTFKESGIKLVLEANEEIVAKAADVGTSVVVGQSDDNQLYWKTGMLTFRENSLGHVFHTLSQEFDTRIIAENEKILSCGITATFKRQSLETIIEVIKSTHGLDSHIEEGVIVISGDGCE